MESVRIRVKEGRGGYRQVKVEHVFHSEKFTLPEAPVTAAMSEGQTAFLELLSASAESEILEKAAREDTPVFLDGIEVPNAAIAEFFAPTQAFGR